VAGDVEANLHEHVRMARLAAAEGARVIVFPELSLIGYELALAAGLAFSENDPRLFPLLDVAAGQGVTLIVGASVQLKSSLYIGAFVLTSGAFKSDVYDSAFAVNASLAAGTYYFTLQNATASDSGAVYWDINNGPSTAFLPIIGNANGQVFPGTNSNSFQLFGQTTPVPEPGSLVFLSIGLTSVGGLAWMKKRRTKVVGA